MTGYVGEIAPPRSRGKDKTMRSVALSPQTRDAALEALAATTAPGGELDILVVGGGVVGAGAALDAATRGLTVGLVEARDFASGTSSRSSKLIHGGLRYLEMLDFRLVAEALQERGLLIQKLAPHLIKPVPFVYPLQHRGRPFDGLDRPGHAATVDLVRRCRTRFVADPRVGSYRRG